MYIIDSENLNTGGKVGIRVVEPAAVLYEVLLNTFLILVMLRKVTSADAGFSRELSLEEPYLLPEPVERRAEGLL